VSNKSDIVLYKEGMNYLKAKDFENAVEIFTELEIIHPYSSLSSKSQLMSGFAQYMANEYEEAILTLTKFIELNPDHESIPYAMYLKAYSYYERMPAVNFDQRTSEKAIEEFRALINKFPKSRYARKSIGHLNTLNNHLAAREVEIAKFYQSQGFYLASIKRYKKILSEFKKSTHIPEAIFRLIECYISLGLSKQAIYLYRILEYNFKKSMWVKEAKQLVLKKAGFIKFKKKELDLKKLNIDDFDLM
tara:strand:- start:30 stop:770 length:741 start_codon:yes stop_codon:yes gene_type:complete